MRKARKRRPLSPPERCARPSQEEINEAYYTARRNAYRELDAAGEASERHDREQADKHRTKMIMFATQAGIFLAIKLGLAPWPQNSPQPKAAPKR